MPIIELMLAAALASPPLGEVKVFKDWIAGCDNGLACQASAMMPKDDIAATLTVRRDSGPNALPEAWLRSVNVNVRDVSVDGKRLGIGFSRNVDDAFVVAPKDVARLLRALQTARRANVINDEGKNADPILVNGASAALLYIDTRQGRIDTAGAVVRRGNKSDSSISQPPPLPIRYSVKGSARPPRHLSERFIAKVRKDFDCADETDDNLIDHARLDDRHTFASITLSCLSGAYNSFSANYIITEDGKVRPALFDDGQQDHANLSWFEKERRLRDDTRARGIGDCGSRNEYVWDGERFRLVGVGNMDVCRGVIDYIPRWRAKVVEQ